LTINFKFRLRDVFLAVFWVAAGVSQFTIGDVRDSHWAPNLFDGVLLSHCLQVLVTYCWPILAVGSLFGRTGAALLLSATVLLFLSVANAVL
jgi:hypothetical protein